MLLPAAIIILTADIVTGLHSDPFGHSQIIEQDRQSRFITFNNDASNIRLEMVFAIPFLHIPIGSSNQGLRPTVDVNLKSLIVAGMVFFLLFFVVPGIIRVTLPNSGVSRGWENSHAGRMLEKFENSLDNAGVDVNECWNQGVCYIFKKSEEKVSLGQASSWHKIINGIATSSWIHSIIPDPFLPSNCAYNNYTCSLPNSNFVDFLSRLGSKSFNTIKLG